MMVTLKQSIYNLIRDDDDEKALSGKIFDGLIIALIVINTIQIIVDTFSVPSLISRISYIIEIASVIIFTIEYLARIWTVTYIYPEKSPIGARFRYAISFMAIIDLLAILPFYIPFVIPIDLRVLWTLRLLRLLRLFKINRYTDALREIGMVFKLKASQLLSSSIVVFLLMLIASILMYNIENTAQPNTFKNVFDSLWWALATFTTVGYGDIYPVTAAGKLLSAIIAVLGIGLVAVPTGIISAGFSKQMEKTKEDPAKHYCPYCGERIE